MSMGSEMIEEEKYRGYLYINIKECWVNAN